MVEVVPAGEIEGIVGETRRDALHLARAVSAEQQVYILHSAVCLTEHPDLRRCPYSTALGTWGIDDTFPEDVAIGLRIDADGALAPIPLNT